MKGNASGCLEKENDKGKPFSTSFITSLSAALITELLTASVVISRAGFQDRNP
jgi:hypothetical protein